MIYIYLAENTQQLPLDRYHNYLRQLPSVMAEKIQRFRHWEDAQASLYGKLMLIEGLKRYGYDAGALNLIDFSDYGRPSLVGGPEFNISHSGSLVVCTITKGRKLGIDIEEVKDIDLDDFRSIWRQDEWDQLNSPDGSLIPFFTLWTKKEAIIKADGKGLSIPLKDIFVGNDTAHIGHDKWYLKQLSMQPSYLCHLASDQPIDGPIKILKSDY